MHLKTQYLGSCCWCWFRFCWSSSCHSCWVWLYRNVSHEKASAVLAVLRRIITCLNFSGDCIGANKLPYKGACSYLVDCIIIWRLLWEWEYELNSRQPLQRAIFLFVRMFLNRSPASFRSRTESCYWLTVGKDFIGSFGAEGPYWAQVLRASHISWMKFRIPDQKRTSSAISMFDSPPKWWAWILRSTSFCIDCVTITWAPV